MNISQLKQSRFLTRADVGRGVLATIKEVYQDNIAKDGAPEELRWCLEFDELDKPLVLNSTNAQIIASVIHSDETDSWKGHKIVLYDDPNVSFGGKLVGGIRVRAPRPQATQPAPTPPRAVQTPKQPTQATDQAQPDDVPF